FLEPHFSMTRLFPEEPPRSLTHRSSHRNTRLLPISQRPLGAPIKSGHAPRRKFPQRLEVSMSRSARLRPLAGLALLAALGSACAIGQDDHDEDSRQIKHV